MNKLHKEYNIQSSSPFDIEYVEKGSIPSIFVFIQNINKEIKEPNEVNFRIIFHPRKFKVNDSCKNVTFMAKNTFEVISYRLFSNEIVRNISVFCSRFSKLLKNFANMHKKTIVVDRSFNLFDFRFCLFLLRFEVVRNLAIQRL